jgi:hypothetical protein
MYTVSFNNTAGELESKTAQTPEQAAEAAIAMIEAAGVLYNGDHITIRGEADDE